MESPRTKPLMSFPAYCKLEANTDEVGTETLNLDVQEKGSQPGNKVTSTKCESVEPLHEDQHLDDLFFARCTERGGFKKQARERMRPRSTSVKADPDDDQRVTKKGLPKLEIPGLDDTQGYQPAGQGRTHEKSATDDYLDSCDPIKHFGRGKPLIRVRRQELAMEAARAIAVNLSEPHAIIALQPSAASTYLERPKVEFLQECLQNNLANSLIIGNDAGEEWTMKFLDDGTLSLGWKKLSYENKLEDGDACLFVLRDASQCILRAQFFRLADMVENVPGNAASHHEISADRPRTELFQNDWESAKHIPGRLVQSPRNLPPGNSDLKHTLGRGSPREGEGRKPPNARRVDASNIENEVHCGKKTASERSGLISGDDRDMELVSRKTGAGIGAGRPFTADRKEGAKSNLVSQGGVGSDSAVPKLKYETLNNADRPQQWPENGCTYDDMYVSKRRPVKDAERANTLECARKCHLSNLPTFLAQLRKMAVYEGLFVRPPESFIRDYLPLPEYDILLMDVHNSLWKARVINGTIYWKHFAVNHYLEENDVVVFELFDDCPPNLIFSVHIFRVVDIEVSQADPVEHSRIVKRGKCRLRQGAKRKRDSQQSEISSMRKPRPTIGATTNPNIST